MPDYYFLSVEANNVLATVKLNDAPVVVHDSGAGISMEKPVFTWLAPRENTLSVSLVALPGEEKIRGEIKVSLFLHDNTADVPTAKEVLASIVYPADNDPGDVASYEKAENFDFSSKIQLRVWQDTPKIDSLKDSDRADILSLLQKLQAALVSGDAETATLLQRYKIDEDALAEDKDVSTIIDITKSNYQWLASQGALKSPVLSLDNLTFSIVGKNQMIYVTDKRGGHPIQLESEDMFFEIPVFMGKVNGSWTIVR